MSDSVFRLVYNSTDIGYVHEITLIVYLQNGGGTIINWMTSLSPHVYAMLDILCCSNVVKLRVIADCCAWNSTRPEKYLWYKNFHISF